MIFESVLRDLRYAVRLLVRAPGFTLAAVLTLALGLGANTAIFTVAWQAILKPLPYPAADRLVNVWETVLPRDAPNTVMPGNFHDWQRDGRSFESIAAYTYFQGSETVTGGGDPEQWRVRYVTGDYFRVFGMPPLVGRPLDETDMADSSRAIVISEAVWRNRFGDDRSILNREIRFGADLRIVVGVMPAAFDVSAGRVDAWGGMQVAAEQPGQRLRAHYLGVVARLKSDVTIPQATQDVKAIAARAAQLYPEANGNLSAAVESMSGARGGTLSTGLTMLAGAAGLVLLMACANLASLQLARGISRQREFTVRAALGASRTRIVTQLVCESLALAAIGAGAGLAVGSWLLGAIGVIAPSAARVASASGMDGTVVVYAVVLAVLSATLAAVAPAWRAAGRATAGFTPRLNTGDRRVTLLRTALVTTEVALAVVLLVGATLLLTSLSHVLHVDPGFEADGVAAFDVSLPNTRYDTYAKRAQLFSSVLSELKAVPGVTSACAINQVPFDTGATMTYVPEGQTGMIVTLPRNVTPECFDLLRLRVNQGRPFTDHEPTRAAIVSASFAKQAWGAENPIGKRLHVGVPTGDLIDVIGVVNDSRQISLETRAMPQVYEVMSEQSAFPPNHVLVRVGRSFGSIAPDIRRAVRRVDPDQAVANLRSLTEMVGASTSDRQFTLWLIAAFAIVALVLAAVGIYGLLAQVVAERTAEIGIRLALGASASSAVRLVMRRAWLAVGIGLPIGLGTAYAASRVIATMLFGVSATDPIMPLGAGASLAVIALLAAWVAARRAAHVDPVQALRG